MASALKTNVVIDRKTRQVLLVLATLVCAGLMPLGAVGVLFSPLIFDARGNLFNPLAWIGFALMISFWIVCIVAPYVAWGYMSAPLVWALALVTVLQFVPG
jgi:hypothetical protein